MVCADKMDFLPARHIRKKKKPGKLPGFSNGIHALYSASTSVVTTEHQFRLDGLKLLSSHLARPIVAHNFEANFLALDDFAHSSALHGGDVNEHIRPAIVRLNKAESLSGIVPFNCANGHNEPFHGNKKIGRTKVRLMVVSIFEREVRPRCDVSAQ
jgi:hypothetical protein